MGELQQAVYDRLRTDFQTTQPQPGGLGFLVSDKWLTVEGPGSTPDAFTATGRLKRAIVVLDPDSVEHPSGPAGRDAKRLASYPVLYLFAEAHQNGRAAIEAMARRIETLFDGWEPVLPSGERPAVSVPGGRTGARDDESFPGNVRAEVRLAAVWSRRMTA